MSIVMPLDSAFPEIERRFVWDEAAGTFHIQTVQAADDVLEANKREANDGRNGFSAGRHWRKIAEIPMTTLDQWAADEGLPVHWLELSAEERAIWIKRHLRSSDWSLLRTVGGGI